jgi:Protein of unknown function (DUF3455)
MKHRNEFENRTTRGILPLAGATALAAALTISSAQPAHADEITPPDVPAQLAVNDGSRPFLKGRGVGTQNYVCLPSGSGFDWNLFTPEAVLLDVDGSQLTTHFFGPNPDENRTIRAAWRDSRDTSTVWGAAVATATSQTDPQFVAKNAIPWVLLDKAGVQAGPTGDRLTKTTHIQRVNTVGGVAPPASTCSALADVGKKAFVPYTADYFLYFNPDAN